MLGKEGIYRYGLLLYLLLWFIGSLWLMGRIHSGAITELLGINIASSGPYLYCALSGAVGGALYALRLLHEYFEGVSGRWAIWYVLRPIQCGGAAVMTIILFESGIMLLQIGDSLEARVGISFLIGFGYGKLMDKLKALTETLFNGNGKKDADPGGDAQQPK